MLFCDLDLRFFHSVEVAGHIRSDNIVLQLSAIDAGAINKMSAEGAIEIAARYHYFTLQVDLFVELAVCDCGSMVV